MSSMDLFDAIANRYSYRGEFTAASVPREHLEKIVAAGIHAPSACNEQVTTFVVVDDRNLLRQIAEIMGKPVCHSAPAMIACVADPRPVFAGLSFAGEDCAAAVENMLLGHYRPGLRHGVDRRRLADRKPRRADRPTPWRSPRQDDPCPAASRRAGRAGPAAGKTPFRPAGVVQSLRRPKLRARDQ